MTKTNLPHLGKMILNASFTLLRSPTEKDLLDFPQKDNEKSIKIELLQLKKYKKMFPNLIEEIPLSYLYLIAQRAQLAMMLNKKFPFSIPGMIHLSNKLNYLGKINLNQDISINQTINLIETTKENTKKIIFEIDFYQEEKIVANNQSIYLTRIKKIKNEEPRQKKEKENQKKKGELLKKFYLEKNSGLRYAKISCDYNPIHLNKILAKGFGFKKAIIHGMYMNALIQEELERINNKPIKEINISFLKPITIPNTVNLYLETEETNNFYICTDNSENLKLKGDYKI